MEQVSKVGGWISWLVGKTEKQGGSDSKETGLSEPCREKNICHRYTSRDGGSLTKLAEVGVNSSSYAEELPLPMNGNINPAGIAGSGESSDKRLNIYLSTQKGIHSNRHMAHRRRSLMDGTRDQTKLLGNPQFEALRRAHSAEGEPRESEVNLNSLHNTEPAKRTLARFAVLVTNAKTHLTAFSNTLLNTESSKSVSSEICKEFAQSANDHDTISVAGGLNTSPKKPEKADEENSMDFKSPIKRPTYFPSTPILMRLGSSRSKKSRTSSKRNKQRTEINAIDTPPSIGNQRILSCSSPDLNEWRINNTDRNSKPNDTISSELISPRVVSENNVYLNMKTGQDTRKMVRDSDKCGSLACLTTINEAATQLTANPASSIREFTDIKRKDPNDDHCAFLSHRNNLFSQKRSSFNENNMRRDQLRRLQSMMVDNQTKSVVGTSRGRILINMQYFNPSSTFRVSLMKAVDIQASFKVSKSATIVAKVSLMPGMHKKKAKKKVVFSENPDIFEDFDFTDISFLELLDMHLKVSLYSKDGFFSRTKLIGAAYISMINYDVSVEKALWKTLRSLPEKNSQMVVDDLDVGFETEYPSRMSDSEFLVNQCYQFHNVNTLRRRLNMQYMELDSMLARSIHVPHAQMSRTTLERKTSMDQAT